MNNFNDKIKDFENTFGVSFDDDLEDFTTDTVEEILYDWDGSILEVLKSEQDA